MRAKTADSWRVSTADRSQNAKTDKMAGTADSWRAKTADSWSSWGRSTGGFGRSTGFNKSEQDKMYGTGESWHSFGSWGNKTASRLKDAIYAKSSLNPDVSDHMLLECFAELDRRGDGVVRPKQLYKAFHKSGFKVSKAAMRAIIIDMGLDPSEGIDYTEFVKFFRRAEELTSELENKSRLSCNMGCCVCIMILLLITCIVFLGFILGGEGDKTTQEGYRVGAACSGIILGLLMLNVLLLPMVARKVIPPISACCNAISAWLFRPPKALDEPEPHQTRVVIVAPRNHRVKEKNLLTLPKPPPESYNSVQVVRPHTEEVDGRDQSLTKDVLYSPANPVNAVVCQADARSQKERHFSRSVDRKSRSDCNKAPHLRDEYRLAIKHTAQHLRPYNPAHYETAAAASASHVSNNFSVMNVGPHGSSQLAALPARPGAAKKWENVREDVELGFNSVDVGPTTDLTPDEIRKLMRGGDGRPDSWTGWSKGMRWKHRDEESPASP